MRSIAVSTPDNAWPRPTRAAAAAPDRTGRAAHRVIVVIVARLMAVHRARRAAAVDRIRRQGLAAID